MNKKLTVFDSTLRDGAQGEGISFSVNDKLRITQALDEIGVDYIEAGNPFSNPKDLEFFKQVKNIELKRSKLVAFGSTCRRGVKAEEDANLQSLLSAETPAVAIFGKSWDFHVTDIIKTTLDENLDMISRSVEYLKSKGKTVIYDAEHFFDGYKNNPEYALKTLKAAESAGADVLALCDTNGGCFPDEVEEIIAELKKHVKAEIGVHCHNDSGMAVACSVAAVCAGASHIQGTLIGIGERCGNANLSTIIANLQLKRGYDCIGDNVKKLTPIGRKIAEIANIRLPSSTPYIGKSAFAHKAGMHIDGVNKNPHSFEHMSPDSVGNNRRFLMSEAAGRSSIMDKVHRIDASVDKSNPVTAAAIDKIKEMEFRGYQFEGAEASLELLLRKAMGKYEPCFTLEKFKTIGEQTTGAEFAPATAMVKVSVGGVSELSASEGNGPVNALDKALRRALEHFYPELKTFYLTDYKVRILDSKETSSAVTRVLIESSDGDKTWTTTGVSKDIIEASLIALTDAIEYKLIKDKN